MSRAELRDGLVAAGRTAGNGIVVLTGAAGAGKTWLAQAALAELADAGLLTGAGKYAQGGERSAFGPVLTALSTVTAAALDRLYDPQTGIASLTGTLGVDLEVLLSAGLVVPGLAPGTGLRALDDRRGGATRIIAAACHLLRWLDRFGAARALLIDDWSRAPSEGVALIRALATEPAAQPLTLFLTQRETVTTEAFADLPEPRVIALGALPDGEIAALFAERLGSAALARAAMAALGEAIPDLPFDVTQIADALAASGALTGEGDRVRIDERVLGGLAFDADARVAALDPAARRAAVALALWGDSAPGDALQAALGPGNESAFDALDARGIVSRLGGRIAFNHDRLREAALHAAPPAERAAIATQLAENLPVSDGTEAVALHLRCAGGIEAAAPERWRDRFAQGAVAARGRGDAAAAMRFAEAALALRARAAPPDRATDRLILREGVLAAADRDDIETEPRARALIAAAGSFDERCADYETGAVALRLAGQTAGAWRLACEGLRFVGIAPPASRPQLALIAAALRWRWSRRRDTGTMGAEMTAGDAFTGVAASAAMIAYHHQDPRGTALIGFRASQLASPHARRSAYWQSVDAFLYAALGARAASADAGERALAAFADQRVHRAKTLYQAIFFGVHWRRPLASQRARFRDVIRIALLEGDLVTASYGWRIFIMSGWRTAASLDVLREEAIVARRALRALGEETFVAEMDAMVALLTGLTGGAPWDPAVWRRDIPTRNHVIDLELSNLAGDWPETLRRAAALRSLRRDYDIQADSVVLRFHESLARLRCGKAPRRGDVAFVRRAAALNPHDHRPKLLLLEAETLRRRGRDAAAAYATAVEAAAAADSRLDAALAATCAAAAARDPAAARGYRARAAAIWRDWGVRVPTVVASEPLGLPDAEERAAAAERGDRAKSLLLAHVGHEMRTPLQALQSLLDLSAETGKAVSVADVRPVLASLTAVIDDLDILGDLADDRALGKVRPVDLAGLVRSEIAVWRGQTEVALLPPPALPLLACASDRIRQIVRNLISNAVKYGGTAPIEVALERIDERVAITVSDRGPGIAPADRQAIFQPFARGAFSGDGRGAGLGLALSHRIAERLGGTLSVTPREGGGSCFTLAFPVSAAPEPAAIAAATGCAILLVEDDPLIRRLVGALLERAGHRVEGTGTAAAGIAAWRGGGFDVAIVDMGLPDASGATVLAAIRARDAETPVILLTAATGGEAEAAAAGDPRVRVARKPASAEALDQIIAELAGRPEAPSVGQLGTPPLPDDFDALYAAARTEIVIGARACLRDPAAATHAGLHRLAGLAAQFGWMPVALAVEALGAAISDGSPPDPAVSDIEAALAGMAA